MEHNVGNATTAKEDEKMAKDAFEAHYKELGGLAENLEAEYKRKGLKDVNLIKNSSLGGIVGIGTEVTEIAAKVMMKAGHWIKGADRKIKHFLKDTKKGVE